MWKQPLATLQLQYASTELLARVLGFQENYQFCGEWNLPRMAYDADAEARFATCSRCAVAHEAHHRSAPPPARR